MGIQLGNQEDLFNKIKDKSIDAIITDPRTDYSGNIK